MVKIEKQDRATLSRHNGKSCCQELLQEAIAGTFSTDLNLERMLDFLERTS
ncbi:MAG: hypothetical protein ABJQ34_18880 [Paracoccaceae bacterium]